MKKTTIYSKIAVSLLSVVSLVSCGPNYKEGQVVIDKYCELNLIEHNAPAGPEKEAAAVVKKSYEKEVDDKYFKDNKMYQFILDGMKKCDESVKK